MNNEFDDELSRMDELEKESDSPINKALSLDDPISELKQVRSFNPLSILSVIKKLVV